MRASGSFMRRCSCTMAVSLGSLTWPRLRGWSGVYGPYSAAIRFPGNGEGAHRHALELALARRRLIRPILLDLQLRLDADLFEIALDHLRRIDQVAAVATGDRERAFSSPWDTRLRPATAWPPWDRTDSTSPPRRAGRWAATTRPGHGRSPGSVRPACRRPR